ncbi:hypothetical protein D9M68_828610 [compost metagenome]
MRGGNHDATTRGQVAQEAPHAVSQDRIAFDDQRTKEGTARGGVSPDGCRRRMCAAGGLVIHHEQTPPRASSAAQTYTCTPSATPPSDNRITHIPLLCPRHTLNVNFRFGTLQKGCLRTHRATRGNSARASALISLKKSGGND